VIYILIWTTVVYDPVAHWIWSSGASFSVDPTNVGWLRGLGAIDFAGGIVIHLTAGISAFVATLILGKRRYTAQKDVPAHNIPFIWIGGFLLWFGWFGFNGGSAGAISTVAIQAAFNSQVAASVGLVFWMILELIFTEAHKPTSVGAITGAIVGLACITPGSGYVTTGASLVYGIVGPGLAFLMTRFKEKVVFDDAVDVMAAHGLGGFSGAMLTGLFATQSINPSGPNGAFYGNPLLLAIQLLACVVAAAVAAIVTAIVLIILKYTIGIQVSDKTEHSGLDMKYHAETAYKNGNGELIDLNQLPGTPRSRSGEFSESEEFTRSNEDKSEKKKTSKKGTQSPKKQEVSEPEVSEPKDKGGEPEGSEGDGSVGSES